MRIRTIGTLTAILLLLSAIASASPIEEIRSLFARDVYRTGFPKLEAFVKAKAPPHLHPCPYSPSSDSFIARLNPSAVDPHRFRFSSKTPCT